MADGAPGPGDPRTRLDELRQATLRRASGLVSSFDGIVEAASDVATDDEHDPEGHTIVKAFAATQTCLPDVQEIVVGGNTLSYQGILGDASSCSLSTVLSLTSSTGQVKFVSEEPAYIAYTERELVDDQGRPIIVTPGDILSLSNGPRVITTSIPSLSVAANVSLNRITGRAPAGRTVNLTVYNSFAFVSIAGPMYQWSSAVVADANGDFQVDTPLQAGDRVEATVRNRMGIGFTAIAVVPGIELTLYQNTLRAMLPPLSPLTITLQTAGVATPTVYVGATSDRGVIRGTSTYVPALLPAAIRAGDRVIVQAGSYSRNWLIPTLTAEVDLRLPAVSGVAPPNHRLSAISLSYGEVSMTQSDGTGHYQSLLPSGYNPQAGLVITLFTADGDRLSLFSRPNNWIVQINSPCLEIHTPRTVNSGTLTVTNAQGVIRLTQPLVGYGQMSWQLCLSDGTTPIPLQTGDHLSLATDTGSWDYTVPVLTARHDARRGVVTGSAPAPGFVTIETPVYSNALSSTDGRTVTIGANGTYGVDISDVAWRPGQQGMLRYTDPAGNIVVQTFVLTGIQHWLPWIGHP